jgi:predicted AlkP superfamily phosphohydrolase/phosphomutase
MQNSVNKAIVIGLDGATFTLLQPLMDEGNMPNLKKIMENGASGILYSTYPPLTAPAWSSFATGKNPGKHGAHDFVIRKKNGDMVIIDSTRINGKKIWNILSEYNKKVGVIHFPISYPPEKVNGFMISGFISPPGTKNLTYPSELFPEILKAVGDYVFNVKVPVESKWRKLDLKEIKLFIDKLCREVELRYKTFKYLTRTREWDFLYVLFMSFDKVQHVLWKYLSDEEKDPRKKEIYEYTLKCYRQIDEILGNILKEINEQTTLIIMSDHGFGTKKKWFYINKWLEKNGYLVKNTKKLIIAKIKEKLGIKTEKYFEGIPAPTVRRHKFLQIEKTKAYSPNSSSYGVFINLRGRDMHGIVEKGKEYQHIRNELKDKLLSLKDSETGHKIFEDVFSPEEIYNGPFIENAPDLILFPAEGYMVIDSLFNFSGKDLVKVKASEGTHRPEGIFIALDKKSIKKNIKIDNINIMDIAPTILYLMGLPVPPDMDGKVIVPIFNDMFLESNPIIFADPTPEESKIKEESIYTAEDERQIINELKGLGYID